ncbi:MAG: carboxy terminal-processing peptidase [Planctomycetaceae bacterium]|nr:carboxy terminal-processing peptidase [Planctomycetaceae bacterium]
MKSVVFRRVATLSLFAVCLIVSTIGAQQLAQNSNTDGTTAQLVCKMIERFHINQAGINDEVSSRLFDRYVKDLDPNKLYFLEADIHQWDGKRKQLDDQLLQGDTSFAAEVFRKYLSLLEQQIEVAHRQIDREHDFSLDEELDTDGESLPWAKTPEEREERWRKRIKYELLDRKLDGKDLTEAREQLHRRYRTLASNLKMTDDHEILEMYLTALARCFDPHSSYMSPQTLEDFQINMRLSLEGIGAQLRYEDGFTVVAEVVAGGAADKDGRLKPGDKIVAVAQDTGEFVDIVEMKLKDVVRLIRGAKGTTVRLKVKKSDSSEQGVYDLTRQKIELTEAEVKGEILDLNQRIGRPLKVGVINIPSFYRDFAGAQAGSKDFKSTEKDVRKVLDDFNQKGGVDLVVIDLRNNGGGALSEAIGVSGLFIKKGPVVQVKELDGTIRAHQDEDPDLVYGGPLVVICNRLSASASEIFAGVIKDYGRGLIVGDTTTHGKGTVQNVMPVTDPRFRLRLFQGEDRGALKLTIQQFYRVNGDSTQNRGVRSDVVLPSRIDHLDLGESFLENALAFDRIRRADGVYDSGLTSSEITKQLQQTSQARVSSDPEFQKTNEQIAKLVERKNRKTISLNESVLSAQRKAEESGTDEDPFTGSNGEEPGAKKENKEVFPVGNYNNEVLNIAADYLDLLKQGKVVQRDPPR